MNFHLFSGHSQSFTIFFPTVQVKNTTEKINFHIVKMCLFEKNMKKTH